MAIQAAQVEEESTDLGPVASGFADKTFLGGMSLGARTWLFFLACVLAGAAFIALFIHVDERLDSALQTMQRATRIDQLVNTVERGTYSLQARQRDFLLTRNTEIADGFSADLADVSTALDELFAYPDAEPLAQHVTTIRDGLVQYDQQFQSFLDTEREIGIGTETGLSAQLRRTSMALRTTFRDTGNANLINQIERIDQQGEETVLSGSKKGVEEIRKRYAALAEFIKVAEIPETDLNRINELLRTHETQMLSMINARFELSDEARRFAELFDYFVPSLTGLAGFAERFRIEAAANVRNMQLFARYTILGGSAAILLWLMFFGLVLIKSLTGPARRIADALDRIARGAQHVSVPAQGNRDDFGRIARLLDGWADTIIEADHLRRDLARTRDRLDRAVLQSENNAERAEDAERRADAAETAARAAAPKALPAPTAQAAPEDAAPRRRPSAVDAYRNAADAEVGGGPISSVSAQLQNFSQYVTAAANDVERTEALIKGLDQMTQLVDDIGGLVLAIRDQANSLAFRTPGKEAVRDPGSDNLIAFSGDGANKDAERMYAQRFDQLRDATERTERTAFRIKETLEEVSEIGRSIAETASQQALDATHKLLSQSEYLQNMLDDILSKVHPAKPGTLSEPKTVKRSNEDPFA
jgi:methyl-accepting chemotaxis protein/CHASE3 domain sensor protein